VIRRGPSDSDRNTPPSVRDTSPAASLVNSRASDEAAGSRWMEMWSSSVSRFMSGNYIALQYNCPAMLYGG